MIQAIVYTSNTGTTAQYAEFIGSKTGLPVYSLKDTSGLARGTEIIYLGWLMAGNVRGYKKAAEMFTIRALCGVGMGATGSQISDINKANAVPAGLPVFTMRGGFDINKLHGVYKFMMGAMRKTAGKKLSEKTDRTEDEDAMMNMMLNGGNYVDEANATAVLEWYNNNQNTVR